MAMVQFVEPIEIDSEFFEVQGAGKVQVGKSGECTTGTAVGVHFGVEWGEHGYAGGVLDKQEALRLADFIYETFGCNSIKKIGDEDETD